MLQKCRINGMLFLIVSLFTFGCASALLPEEEPVQENPTLQSVDYPAPESIIVPPSGYPAPLAIAPQSIPYPEPERPTAVQILSVDVVDRFAHNQTVFTQGLAWIDGVLYESGGLRGQSALYQVNLADGQPIQSVSIDEAFFAEGIAVLDDKIIMLTWQSETALIFDRDTFAEIGRFNYSGEGWGLCYDKSNGQLWMSDGSQQIVSRNPKTFEITGEISVTFDGSPVTQINELECLDGVIYANLWKSDKIVGIDQLTGNVIYEINALDLLTSEEQAGLQPGRQVLNGIAFNEDTGRFYLTGKHWPRLFEVEFK